MNRAAWRKVVEGLADSYGGSVAVTKGGHLKITAPGLSRPVYTSQTPSDYRTVLNLNATLKRAARNGGKHAQ